MRSPPHDALHITDASPPEFRNAGMDVAIDDSKAYLKAWKSATVHFKLLPDTELIDISAKTKRLPLDR